jgi:uncharacterized protein
MSEPTVLACTAFDGHRRIASGSLPDVALATKKVVDRGPRGAVLIFDDLTSEQIEIDFRGSESDVLRRLKPIVAARTRPDETEDASQETPAAPAARGPGRPKLGVVAREVTLLPRHWDWLATQPGGASVALRKLVEVARRNGRMRDRLRLAQESAYRFASAMAGNLVGFEEAMRALFAADKSRFTSYAANWPRDIARHATMLAERVFNAAAPVTGESGAQSEA